MLSSRQGCQRPLTWSNPGQRAFPSVVATIGHLVLTNLRDTRRNDEVPISDAHGAIRLRVPIRAAELGDDDLAADEQDARLRFDYHPLALGSFTFPIQLNIEIRGGSIP
jgi:hypothetical protein